MTYLLDTHAWIWWYMNPDKLSKKVIQLISDPKNYDALLLSAISPWEFCKLIEKERLYIKGDPQKWLQQAFDLPKFRLIPLTPFIACESTHLKPPFHSDPADQIIVASALQENALIITKDKLLHDYKYVKCIW
jgi:PIN domain nuclease of toxin-antitoxin system